MKKSLNFFIFLFFLMQACAKKESSQVRTPTPVEEKRLIYSIIENFNNRSFPGNVWEDYPQGRKQSFQIGFSSRVKKGEKGYSLYIDYDFLNTDDTVGGIWIDLKGIDFKEARILSFWVKGEPMVGFSRVITVSLENEKGERGNYTFGGINADWREIKIPLEVFGIKDKTSLSELNIVIEKQYATSKRGRIYIDDLACYNQQ